MFTSFLHTSFRKFAPSLLPLFVGIVIGGVCVSEKPPSVTAQTPNFGPTGSDGYTDASTDDATPRKLGENGPRFGQFVGDRVSVIEARDGRDVAGSGDLIGFSHVDDSGTQVITIVDAEKRWMAVYHVGSEGKIRLASSREIAADFTLELNVTPPLPDQIRRMQGLPPRSH